MKNLLIFLGISCAVFYCRAQQLPLNTLMKDIPANAHVKDLNNELTPYIGIYRANYQGNEISLYITKQEDRPTRLMNKGFYNDVLSIRYIVKNSSGIILQDTQSMNLNDQSNFNILSLGATSSLGTIAFIYDGTNCGIGWGDIYLKKINNTQISWEYRPDSTVIDSATCPPSTDKKVYLPVTKDLIFTKQ